MPLNLSPEDRRLLIVASVVFLASTVLAILLSPAESDAKLATTYSAAPEGAKAAYLLLHESGYRVERWARSPAEIGDPANTLLIITDPTVLPTEGDKDTLGKFLSAGGEVLLAGSYASSFVSEPAPTSYYAPGWQTYPALGPSPQAVNAAEIKINAESSWIRPTPGIGLYADTERYVVMEYPHGAGTLLWLASASILSNAGLNQSDNLNFFLVSVGSKSRRVLWDEYFHGYSAGRQGVPHPQLTWLLGQLGFVGVAVLLTFSRHSVPQRLPRLESRLSPLEYVRALGQLYEHAHATNVAVDVSYERFRYTLGKRLGLHAAATSGELARAAAERWHIDRQDLLSLLETCESARFFEDLSAKEALALVQRLHKYSVLLKLFLEAVQEKS
jgi:hypothetical protein